MRRPHGPTWTQRPFRLTPDAGLYYESGPHREALACLESGLRRAGGLALLTGAPGTGKTSLLEALAGRLEHRCRPVVLGVERMETERDFLRAVCAALCIPCRRETARETQERIHRFARRLRRRRRPLLLLLDEADELSEPVRDAVLRFHRKARAAGNPVLVVLAGLPPLVSRMAGAAARAPGGAGLPPACRLREMPPAESLRYVLHRLCVAGCPPPEEVFSPAALRRVLCAAGGVPRTVNVLCADVLERCAAQGAWPAREDTVREALRVLDLEAPGGEGAGALTLEETERLLRAERPRAGGAAPARPRPARGPAPSPGGDRAGPRAAGAPPRAGAGPDGPGALSLNSAIRFLALFLLVVLLLGGGTLLQVIGHRKDARESRERLREVRPGAARGDGPGAGALPGPAADGPGGPAARVRALPLERYLEERRDGVRSQLDIPAAPSPEGGPIETLRDRDLAGLALDRFGRLDEGLLQAFRKANPGVMDWNRLGADRKLLLPAPGEGAGPGIGPGVDIPSIRVGTYDGRSAAARAAEELNRAGLQNLFIAAAGGDGTGSVRRYDLFAGVFPSEADAERAAEDLRRSGLFEARPARLREPSLARVLHPHRPPAPAPSPAQPAGPGSSPP